MQRELTRVNLNLLMALDALLQEKSVTKAGQKLFITQSAMSNLLKQLREIFNDELFIRGQAGRLIPSNYALALAPRVTEAIEKLENVFKKEIEFDAKKMQVTFTIGLSDYTEFVVLPHLVQRILKDAPNVNLVIKNLTYIANKNNFETDEIDMAVGLFRTIPEGLTVEKIFQDCLVFMADRNNPLLQAPITPEQFAQARHLIPMYTEKREEMMIENFIRDLGFERKGVVIVPNTLPALASLINTDLIAVVSYKIASQYCYTSKLAYQKFAFEYPKLPISLVWHPKQKNNPAHRWMREIIAEIGKQIEENPYKKEK